VGIYLRPADDHKRIGAPIGINLSLQIELVGFIALEIEPA